MGAVEDLAVHDLGVRYEEEVVCGRVELGIVYADLLHLAFDGTHLDVVFDAERFAYDHVEPCNDVVDGLR